MTNPLRSEHRPNETALLAAHMDSVRGYGSSLQRLQDGWDQLSLLGQMSGIAADITSTATEFREVSRTLLDSLSRALLRNTLHRMQTQAQVAIDILVRNLFERTADVGFLSMDNEVRAHLVAVRACAPEASASANELRARFRAYVAKYSVYDDVIVLAPDGRILLRLQEGLDSAHCTEPLVTQAQVAGTPFVESFGPTGLLGGRRGLVYSAGVREPGRGEPLGVLCLSFRFDDEMLAVFDHLAPVGPCSVVVLCDGGGGVIASSDPWQLPVGAPLAPARALQNRLFFAGREYLVATVAATPYQGYAGPDWSASMLVPLDQVFRQTASAAGADLAGFPPGTLENSPLVATELRSIPKQAQRIQRALERSVWNGEVRHRQRAAEQASAGSGGFGAVLLQQITLTGARIESVIGEAVGELQRSTGAALLDEVGACAAFAIDIMDRNLYERANDCRWWALDGSLQRALAEPGAETGGAASAVLAEVNGLYTVYSTLLLLDAGGCAVAASNAAGQAWLGRRIEADWVPRALALHDDQSFVRSSHGPSALYAGLATCVYAAAVRSGAEPGAAAGGRLGAVAIVFDGAPQFEAMLRDTLPKNPETNRPMEQATGLFVTRSGRVISSTDATHFPVGSALPFAAELDGLARGGSRRWVQVIGDSVCAVGVSMSRGYREYDSDGVCGAEDPACLVLIRVGDVTAAPVATTAPTRMAVTGTAAASAPARQLASFHCNGEWLAIDAAAVVEAIESAHVTPMPGSGRAVAGLVMHAKQPVPVIDLAALRHATPRHRAETESLVIVCRCPGQAAFGLRVDELGQVLDVAPAALQLLGTRLATHDRHAMGLVSFDKAAPDSMLIVLDIEALAREIAGRA